MVNNMDKFLNWEDIHWNWVKHEDNRPFQWFSLLELENHIIINKEILSSIQSKICITKQTIIRKLLDSLIINRDIKELQKELVSRPPLNVYR